VAVYADADADAVQPDDQQNASITDAKAAVDS
jgi:hypothetical protein